jgi:hypothetical protein
MEKVLGKISKVRFGIGGYQDMMLGLFIEFSADSWVVSDGSLAAWDSTIVPHRDHHKWTELARDAHFAAIMRKISKLLNDAKVQDINDLVGKPVELTFDTGGVGALQGWRLLTEVI